MTDDCTGDNFEGGEWGLSLIERGFQEFPWAASLIVRRRGGMGMHDYRCIYIFVKSVGLDKWRGTVGLAMWGVLRDGHWLTSNTVCSLNRTVYDLVSSWIADLPVGLFILFVTHLTRDWSLGWGRGTNQTVSLNIFRWDWEKWYCSQFTWVSLGTVLRMAALEWWLTSCC